LYLDRDVAVIGSSGALLGSSLGKTIDTFKEVVRFNRAPTNGFENDVGSKTTLRVVNNHVFDNIDITKVGFSNSPANFVRDLREQKILYIGPDIKPWERRKTNTHESNTLHLFDYDKIGILKSFIGGTFKENMLVGTIMLTLCIMAKIRPTLLGFDLQPVPRTHYWQDRPKEWNSVHHNPPAEQKLLLKLADKELINVL
jgi:hypothetical protein